MEDIFDVRSSIHLIVNLFMKQIVVSKLCERYLVKDSIISSIEQGHIVPLRSYMLLSTKENARCIIKTVKTRKNGK